MEREHNPSLIYQLKNDHKRLLNIYSELYNIFLNSEKHEIVVEKLIQLKVMLEMHINFEDSILYSYLNSKYKNFDDKLSFIKGAKKEMENIIRVAIKFIDNCSNSELYNKNRNRFQKELKLIGEILMKRIEFEEERLYSLYLP